MKRFLLMLSVLLLFPLLSLRGFAVSEKADKIMEGIDMDGIYENIPDYAREEMEIVGIEDASLKAVKNFKISSLLKRTVSYFTKGFADLKGTFLVLLSFCFIEIFITSFSFDDEIKKLIDFSLKLIMSVFLLNSFMEFVSKAYDVIKDSIRFMYSFVPVFCALTCAGGKITSANAFGGVMLMLCEITGRLLETVFLPFCTFFVIFSVSSVFASSELLIKISKIISGTVTALLIFTAGALAFFLSVSNHMAEASDTVAIKTAGFFAGTFVPVIGSALKDAAGSFRGCMYMIRAALGSFGILAGLVIFLPSIIELSLYKLSLSLISAVFSSSEQKDGAELIDSFKGAVNIVLASLFFVLFIMVISTGIVIFSGYGG